MKFLDDIKLDFSDVLILPKRNDYSSRSDVNVERTMTFKYSPYTWTGVPIIVSNMDTTGTIEMALEMQKHHVLTCLHKYYKYQDIPNTLDKEYFAVTSGIQDSDLQNLDEIIKHIDPKFICLDVANGYLNKFITKCKEVREKYPDKIIIAGNVCTSEGVLDLVLNGKVDIVKVGIGNGCYSEDTKVLMANGVYKKINQIDEGEYVINKDGKPVKVLNVINKGKKEVLKIQTNNWHKDIFVTPDHQYWIGDLSTSSYESIQSSGIAKLLDKQAKTKPKESKYKWKQIGEIENEKMFTLMPNKFEWMLPENFTIDLANFNTKGEITETTIKTTGGTHTSMFNRHLQSDYKLGYIFGTFLGDGNSKIDLNNSSGSCHWSFGLHEFEIANKVQTYIRDLMDYNCTILKKDNKVLSVNCFNKCLTYMFHEFGKKINKQLPQKYYCKNKEYIRGLFDGLIDSDGSTEYNKSGSCNKTFSNTSEHLIELFNWCSINLGISFCSMKNKKTSGYLTNCNENNLQQVYNIKTHTTNRYTNDYVYSKVLSKENYDTQTWGPQTQTWGIQNTWDIEVDCPTHSFIANNAIVHNSACTTRTQTGIGMPQFSAVMECSDTAHGLGAHILSDGGVQCIGDFSKAYGAGADFIMSGSMFAAHTESGGELIEENGKQYKIFYGMSSTTAMNKYMGGVAFYKSSEGKTVKLEYRGPVANTILSILGGIRSSMTYIGAKKIKDIPKCSTFIRVNRQLNQIYSGKEV